jgi:hypothetical protein
VQILHRLHDPEDEICTKSQSSFWRAENVNYLVGYGSIAKIKEYGEDNLVQSYRSYRQNWHATPV